MRPSGVHAADQFHTIIGSWHLYICEDQLNAWMLLEYFDGIFRAIRLFDLKTVLLQKVDSIEANKFIIFNDEDNWLIGSGFVIHILQTRNADMRSILFDVISIILNSEYTLIASP